MTELTPELLRELLEYDPKTGKLYWLKRDISWFKDANRWNARYAGKEAFAGIGSGGYKRGKIFYVDYFSHRVIWAMENGYWPPNEIDHKDHNKINNRLSNLREVTHSENHKNQSLRSNNTSGFNGVRFYKAAGKWQAYIRRGRKFIHLGLFPNIAAAIDARKAANIKYGYHENHGGA